MNQMLFTSIKKNNNNNNNNDNNIDTINTIPIISRRNAFTVRPFIPQQQQQVIPIVNNDQINEKKMKWGAPIWYFFHTLAEKVKENEFLSIRNDLLNNIILICKNLPCPNCAAHATEYMSKINFNVINSKDDLKTLLLDFHNIVNKRKGYQIFTRKELDEKYSKAITINIFNSFLIVFQDKHKSIRMIADDMYRQRLSIILKDWITNNYNKFDM